VYAGQVNVSFESTKKASANPELKVDVDLSQLIRDGNPRVGERWDVVPGSTVHVENLLAQRDPGADINIFFVPDLNPRDPKIIYPSLPIVWVGSNCIYKDDNVQWPSEILGQEIGKFLGCPPSINLNHLMYPKPMAKVGGSFRYTILKRDALAIWKTLNNLHLTRTGHALP
jgi:hypothetical protein